MADMLTLEAFEEASAKVKEVTQETKLVESPSLSAQCGNRVWLKPENMQRTGAYSSLRGAYYKISKLSQEELDRGVITASAGNHAQGVAYAASHAGARSVVVMPTTTPLIKVESRRGLRRRGRALWRRVRRGAVARYRARRARGPHLHPAVQRRDHRHRPGHHRYGDHPGAAAGRRCCWFPWAVAVCLLLDRVFSTFAKLYNPKIRVIGVEPEGAPSLTRALEAGHTVKLDHANTIADGTAVLEVGDKVFPYLQKNLDDVIRIPDEELIGCFLDMVENHKMIVENSGLLTVAALKHLPAENKRVVSILSGGNMDVITMASVVQHGLIQRGRIFTVSTMLPDRPGMLLKVASAIAEQNGNVIKLDHNQFVTTNRNAAVELRVTIEAYGEEHKQQIVEALAAAGFTPQIVQTQL